MLNLSQVAARHKERVIAPDAAPCPRCGAWCPRNEIRPRSFWEPDLHRPTVMTIRVGCYICDKCPPGQRWFTLLPLDYGTSGQYSLQGKETVIDLIRRHKLSIEGAAAVGRLVQDRAVRAPVDAKVQLVGVHDLGRAVPLEIEDGRAGLGRGVVPGER